MTKSTKLFRVEPQTPKSKVIQNGLTYSNPPKLEFEGIQPSLIRYKNWIYVSEELKNRLNKLGIGGLSFGTDASTISQNAKRFNEYGVRFPKRCNYFPISDITAVEDSQMQMTNNQLKLSETVFEEVRSADLLNTSVELLFPLKSSVKSFVKALNERGDVKCVAFGEAHQRFKAQTLFRTFFLDCFESLISNEFDHIFLEVDNNANADFQSYLSEEIPLEDFRSRWLTGQGAAEGITDRFIERLKEFNSTGTQIHLINKVDDPDRDLFFRDQISEFVNSGSSSKAVFLAGAIHTISRPAEERTDWLSAIELLESEVKCYRVLELSRFHLSNKHFERAGDLIRSSEEVSFSEREALGESSDCKIRQIEIGEGNEYFTEFKTQQITISISYFDSIFMDSTKYVHDDFYRGGEIPEN